MSVVIDYKALGQLVPSSLVEEIKEKVKYINDDPFLSDIQKFKVEDWESHIMIGLSTKSLFYVYRYSKQFEGYQVKRLSIADYWFIKDMMEGGS